MFSQTTTTWPRLQNARLGVILASAYHSLTLPSPESRLISYIRGQSGRLSGRVRGAGIVTGVGDDCAVLRIPAGHEVLVTTDFSIEGVHFRREWHSAESVGHRCLARGLSDIAAMGCKPVAAFLSLALPAKLPQKWVNQFFKGFLKLTSEFKVPLAGGDTAESLEGVLADIVVVGSVPKGKAVLRSGARPGDRIYVTGELGGSAAALDLLFKGKKLKPNSFRSHFFPAPRINVGKTLRERNIATAMIDISDGLSTDLSHICDESSVGAEIWECALPRATIGRRKVDFHFALHGGEAYELLFTANPQTRVPAQVAGVSITCIGEMTKPKGLALVSADHSHSALKPGGWQHFEQPSSDK